MYILYHIADKYRCLISYEKFYSINKILERQSKGLEFPFNSGESEELKGQLEVRFNVEFCCFFLHKRNWNAKGAKLHGTLPYMFTYRHFAHAERNIASRSHPHVNSVMRLHYKGRCKRFSSLIQISKYRLQHLL